MTAPIAAVRSSPDARTGVDSESLAQALLRHIIRIDREVDTLYPQTSENTCRGKDRRADLEQRLSDETRLDRMSLMAYHEALEMERGMAVAPKREHRLTSRDWRRELSRDDDLCRYAEHRLAGFGRNIDTLATLGFLGMTYYAQNAYGPSVAAPLLGSALLLCYDGLKNPEPKISTIERLSAYLMGLIPAGQFLMSCISGGAGAGRAASYAAIPAAGLVVGAAIPSVIIKGLRSELRRRSERFISYVSTPKALRGPFKRIDMVLSENELGCCDIPFADVDSPELIACLVMPVGGQHRFDLLDGEVSALVFPRQLLAYAIEVAC